MLARCIRLNLMVFVSLFTALLISCGISSTDVAPQAGSSATDIGLPTAAATPPSPTLVATALLATAESITLPSTPITEATTQPPTITTEAATATMEATTLPATSTEEATTLPSEQTTALPDTATSIRTPIKLRGLRGTNMIQMSLVENDTNISGDYFDVDARAAQGIEIATWLQGTLAPDGSLVMTETNALATGIFTTTLTQSPTTGYVLDGTWTDAQGGDAQIVRLFEVLPATTAYKLTDTTVAEQDEEHHATYTLTYPVITGVGAAGDGFNQAAAALVDQYAAQVKTDFAASQPVPADASHVIGSSLEIDYELISADDRYISILFHTYSYYAGAAHPNSTSFALTYDLEQNREVALADLFKPDSAYLDVLSQWSLEKLRNRPDMHLFEEGAAPKAENFRSWNIDSQGLRIVFDPYAVAAYVYGPQVIYIPFDKLGDLIEPQSIVARLQ